MQPISYLKLTKTPKATKMAHHHLLPFLALILLILPSSSQALSQPTPALFSDDNGFLVSGHNLTDGVYTLSLKPDCGLTLHNTNGDPDVDFNTPTDDSGCELRIDNFGRLVITYADSTKESTILGKAGDDGTYALLFTKFGPAIFGPREWTKNSSSVNQITSTPKKLKQATSNNFIISPDTIDGTANGDVLIALNHDTSAHITSKCALLVKNLNKTLWGTPSTAEPTACKLYLTNRGVLLLLREDSEGLHTQWTGGVFGKVNLYVAALRTYGALDIYGFMEDIRQIPPYSGSVAGNIKMVTA